MARPNLALVRGFAHPTVSRSGAFTTYYFRRPRVPVTDLAITVGGQGQLTGSNVTVHSASSPLSLRTTVLSYNQPARIEAPPARDVRIISASMLRSLGRSTGLATVLRPFGVAALGPARL